MSDHAICTHRGQQYRKEHGSHSRDQRIQKCPRNINGIPLQLYIGADIILSIRESERLHMQGTGSDPIGLQPAALPPGQTHIGLAPFFVDECKPQVY